MNNKHTYDIIFCSLPPLGMDRIYSAPAILKGVAVSAGYQSRCFDFASDFFHLCCNGNFDLFSRLSNYFVVPGARFESHEIELIEKFYDHIVNSVIDANAQYIGLSVFSYHTHRITIDLLKRFQQLGLTDRIVLGGRGISTRPMAAAIKMLNVTESEMTTDLVHIIKSRNLAHHFILGDGEDALIDFLDTGISTTTQHKRDKLLVTWPDYSDYNFDNYQWPNGIPSLDVVGSTGCVRDCDFCDIKKQFGRYRFKDGIAFAEELIALQQKFKINKFILADSLSNGGLKIFRQFVNRLAEHNKVASTPITWTGQYICREMSGVTDIDQYYESIVKSGGEGLTIGAESGSNYVLANMDKKTTVEALFFELEKFRKHGITCNLLTFIGHWSERHEDFVAHCNMLVDLVPYVSAGTISSILLGTSYSLLPSTPSDNNINIIRDSSIGSDAWISRNNRGNTFKVRLQRRLIISQLCRELDIGVEVEESHMLQMLYQSAVTNIDNHNKFFIKNAQNETSQFDCIADIDAAIKSIINHKKKLTVKLAVVANSCNTDPNLVIKINNNTILDQSLSDGPHLIEFEIDASDLQKSNSLLFQMSNKKNNDTEVDNNGIILRDKNIIIKTVSIDNCDLTTDVDFFYTNFYYNDNGKKSQGGMGLWNSLPLCLDFKLPFIHWYSTNTTRNKSNYHVENTNNQMSGLVSCENFYTKISQLIDQMPV